MRTVSSSSPLWFCLRPVPLSAGAGTRGVINAAAKTASCCNYRDTSSFQGENVAGTPGLIRVGSSSEGVPGVPVLPRIAREFPWSVGHGFQPQLFGAGVGVGNSQEPAASQAGLPQVKARPLPYGSGPPSGARCVAGLIRARKGCQKASESSHLRAHYPR